jgi:N-acyl-D-amino-acid deacylase
VGRPFTWTALLTVKGYPYHEKVVAEHDAAWADGVEVWPQVSCRPLVFQMNLSEPFTLNMRPTFRRADGAVEGRGWPPTATRPGGRRLGGRERQGTGRLPAQLGRHFGGRVARIPSWPTARWSVLAEERGCTPLDVMLDISLDDDLEARFWSVLANDDPEGIAWLLPRDNVLLGLADSGAHVSQLCDACFATDLLGNWVRERGVMPLERAIHKLTGEPAGVYGLADRGTVEVGKAADLCVFDPDTVAPGPLAGRLTDAVAR